MSIDARYEKEHYAQGMSDMNLIESAAINISAPGKLQVIRRNGSATPFDNKKIAVALTRAFLAVEGPNAAASTRIHETVNTLTTKITDALSRFMESGTVQIEDIQDQVELALMRDSHHKVARAYVLFREERRRAREANQKANMISQHASENSQSRLQVTLADGRKVPLDEKRLQIVIQEACANLSAVDPQKIFSETLRNLFDGVELSDVKKSVVMSARTSIEQDPNYSYVAARLLLDNLRSEALQFLQIGASATFFEMQQLYPVYFNHYIRAGIKAELLDPKLQDYDLDALGKAIDANRDLQFTYLGLQTLYDRYFLHVHGTRFELPQAFFMRVAMGLAINEKDKTKKTIEFYHLLSSFDFMSSTPTLFNSGTLRPQLSSCYLTTVPDELDGIYSAIKDNALLSKYAGGLGNDWTSVRAMGAYIKGTNGKSLGVVPFLNVADATAVAVNQGGKRKGAVCAYLETWHLDIEEFLELRKNTGDDRRRTHDMNTANWIPDLFMKRVFEDSYWTLFSPNEVPELHETYGHQFEVIYESYEAKADRGEIKNFKRMPASKLWRKMLGLLFETGHPWLTFKDACNLRSPQQHCGVVHSSNLCTEITLNTSSEEIAVCNLGSVNLLAHMNEHGLDTEKLQKTINTAIRMLDNVIDYNFYSVDKARHSNSLHRPIGLGIMGFQDALHQQKLSYASNEAVEFADRTMEIISYYAIQASSNLAEERGAYKTYEGSLWSQGILPLDSIALLKEARGQYLEQDTRAHLDWQSLRQQIRRTGMRNSNVMAIAPTATIANICGVSPSIEPTYQNLYVKSNLSGEFTVVNPFLVAELKQLNLWDEVMVNDLKYFDGSVARIGRIPEEIKSRYATAFEVEPKWLVEAASRRQKWIDQAQSLNIYIAEASGKKLDTLYRMAWLRGLKTTYYLRTLGATSAEKSTITDGVLNAVSANGGSDQGTPLMCSIQDPGCEVCQ